MEMLSNNRKTIFLGQSVSFPGSLIYETLKKIPKSKKVELPVFEEVQMGLSIGLALEGYIPITCFPRFDFLILALNQIVNHADKIDHLTNNQFKSKIIIRTLIGSKKPLDAGPQHTQDYTEGLKKMLKFTKIIKLQRQSNIFKLYKDSLKDRNNKIYLFVEDSNLYI
jgi:pyruvate/2-oxoglutarate/acetoin dehydrogenase E1 component